MTLPRWGWNYMEKQRRSILTAPGVTSLWRGRSTEADGWVLINNNHLHLTIVIDPTIINVCLTNIDIVDGIDCLQVLQHADGSKKFLRVATDTSSWSLGPTIDESGGWIQSGSAGVGCPASAVNKKSDRFKQKSWEYYDGKALNFVAGDIRVTCITHTWSIMIENV